MPLSVEAAPRVVRERLRDEFRVGLQTIPARFLGRRRVFKRSSWSKPGTQLPAPMVFLSPEA